MIYDHARAHEAAGIEYNTFGDRSSPALLLVAGNGAQLFFRDVEFCELLVQKGYFVIRFDNRDAGLSTKFKEAGRFGVPAFHLRKPELEHS